MKRRPIDPERVRELAAKGMTDREIGRLLGRSRETIWAVRRRIGVRPHPDTARRRLRVLPGLTPAVLRQHVALGRSDGEVARLYGTSPATIQRMRARHGVPPVWRPDAMPDGERLRRADALRDRRARMSGKWAEQKAAAATAFGLSAWLTPTQLATVTALASGPLDRTALARAVGRRGHHFGGHANKSGIGELRDAGLLVVVRRHDRSLGRRGRLPSLYMLTLLALNMLANAPKEAGRVAPER